MDHALHNNNEDAIATMTHVNCATIRPILNPRKSLLWFSSGCLLPFADIGDPKMNGWIASRSGRSLSQPDLEDVTLLQTNY
jgi:hypothetical protein